MLIVFQQKHLFLFLPPQRIRNGQLFLRRIRITHEIIFSPAAGNKNNFMRQISCKICIILQSLYPHHVPSDRPDSGPQRQ